MAITYVRLTGSDNVTRLPLRVKKVIFESSGEDSPRIIDRAEANDVPPTDDNLSRSIPDTSADTGVVAISIATASGTHEVDFGSGWTPTSGAYILFDDNTTAANCLIETPAQGPNRLGLVDRRPRT